MTNSMIAKFKVEIETSATTMLMNDGERPVWEAKAFLVVNMCRIDIAETKFAVDYKTEKAAINALKLLIREAADING